MEQGLEAPAHRDEECGKPRPRSDEEKGERARFAVNVTAGDGRSGDAVPRRQGFVRAFVAVGGGKASKGSNCMAGNPVSRQEETL